MYIVKSKILIIFYDGKTNVVVNVSFILLFVRFYFKH